MFNLRKNRKGFTIIELVVVIAIIAILAAIAIPSFVGVKNEAEDAVAFANATTIATAVNTYNTLHAGKELTSISTYATLKTSLEGADYNLWPASLTETQFTAALKHITYAKSIATVNEKAAADAPAGT